MDPTSSIFQMFRGRFWPQIDMQWPKIIKIVFSNSTSIIQDHFRFKGRDEDLNSSGAYSALMKAKN